MVLELTNAMLGRGRLPLGTSPAEGGSQNQQSVVLYVPSEAQVLSYLAEGYVKGAIFGTLVRSPSRAECPDDGHGRRQQQCPGHAQGPVPAL